MRTRIKLLQGAFPPFSREEISDPIVVRMLAARATTKTSAFFLVDLVQAWMTGFKSFWRGRCGRQEDLGAGAGIVT
jgi:hypothetical protein